MTTIMSEHKLSRSAPWENALYPRLRDPEHARRYLDACIEESPPVVGGALCDVIQANKDIPFVAYQVICSYSHYLTVEDISPLVEALQGLDQANQEYLADLYWWLHLLGETLSHGGVKQLQLRAELNPRNIPEQYKTLPEYKQWEKNTAA